MNWFKQNWMKLTGGVGGLAAFSYFLGIWGSYNNQLRWEYAQDLMRRGWYATAFQFLVSSWGASQDDVYNIYRDYYKGAT